MQTTSELHHVWLVWYEQQAHMAHNKNKSIVNISLFVSSPVPPLRFAVLCWCQNKHYIWRKLLNQLKTHVLPANFSRDQTANIFTAAPLNPFEVKVNS